MTLEQMFESFISEKQYLDNRSPRTIKHYRAAFKTYRRFVTGEEVTQDNINSFVIEARRAGMSAGCLNSYIRGFNSFLDWLHEEELTPTRLRIKHLKQEKKIGRSFTDEELRRLLSYKPQTIGERRAHALTLALIDTGARVDEFLSLTRVNVNFESLTIKVKGKGSKERIVPNVHRTPPRAHAIPQDPRPCARLSRAERCEGQLSKLLLGFHEPSSAARHRAHRLPRLASHVCEELSSAWRQPALSKGRARPRPP
jgi:site-specific recombinase XerC